ncbi:hypothetical protein BB558_002247 [Smittium angustum]|uniref:Uncharacterized protein n=1 Tax=Smittium angustum TaxID=133377 RepID=A0A2U1J981_SMIAN|nr:hypothetical protein BB558_002247 [Smittium angustum]
MFKTTLKFVLSALLITSSVAKPINDEPEFNIKLKLDEVKFIKSAINDMCDNTRCNLEFSLGRGENTVKVVMETNSCKDKKENIETMIRMADQLAKGEDLQTIKADTVKCRVYGYTLKTSIIQTAKCVDINTVYHTNKL